MSVEEALKIYKRLTNKRYFFATIHVVSDVVRNGQKLIEL